MLPPGDAAFIQIMDSALADATRRSGAWLACRPGCHQCCHGVFRISQLDAARLRVGLEHLQRRSPALAAEVLSRVRSSMERLRDTYPGDPRTGTLFVTPEAADAFEQFANEEVCPMLDPEMGTCSLYAHRPITCRAFGPPVRADHGFGVCELCFQGASGEDVERGELYMPSEELEANLIAELGCAGETIVTFAFAPFD